MDEIEANEIETIADGVGPSGQFVRTFWHWIDTAPDWAAVRARIDGITHSDDIGVGFIREQLAEATGAVVTSINGQNVTIPARYMQLLVDQVGWFNEGCIGPPPGT